MEDYYDFSFIEYWHFDWRYLMNRIPYDWDSIQMSFENPTIIPCFLHPILSGHGVGASLINRKYVEKLLSLHYKDGKFDLSKKIPKVVLRVKHFADVSKDLPTWRRNLSSSLEFCRAAWNFVEQPWNSPSSLKFRTE